MSPAVPSFACACDDQPSGGSWWRILVGAFLAVNAMTFTLAVNTSECTASERAALQFGTLIAALITTVLLGWPLAVSSWHALARRQVTVEALFVLSYLGSVFASAVSMITGQGPVYWEVAGITLVVYAVGREVGRYSQERVLQSLASWDPHTSRCERIGFDGASEFVLVSSIATGDILRVHPGNAIPVDGVISSGQAFVREADLTGEAFAAARHEGEAVFAGTMVVDATLEVRATAAGSERQLDRITQALEGLSRRPAPAQLIADRLMKWFVPALMLICITTAAFWYFTSGVTAALFNSMAVLLVACPCALGFATPVSVWSGMRRLAALGLIAKNGESIEKLASVDTVVFDKTGTLTLSGSYTPELILLDHSLPRLAEWIAAAESASQHPVALALRDLAEPAGSLAVQRLQVLPGVGLKALVFDRDTRTSHELTIGMAAALCPERVEVTDEAHRLAVLVDGHLSALVRLQEKISEGIDGTVAGLEHRGLHCILMTGDAAVRAERIPIAERHSGLTPEDKLRLCTELSTLRRLAFVGDGINDAAAMSASTVSIAIEGGAPLAQDVADVVWTRTNLDALPQAVAVSRATVRYIRQTIWIAVAYNVAGVALAATGMLHPVAASVLMTVSSLVVTWRSVHLLECEVV